MAGVEQVEAPPAAPAPHGSRQWNGRDDRHWRRLAHVLAVGWLVTLGLFLAIGERDASYADLRQALRGGHVERVVVGEPEQGVGPVTLHWRRSGIPHRAVTGGVPDVGPRLHALHPGLRVVHETEGTWQPSFGAWHAPGWLIWTLFVEGLATFVLLVDGPTPWRATRWAWLWLLTTGWVGVIAFVLLGGPGAGVPAPRRVKPWLTGGWAFLLALVLRSVL